MALDPNIGRIKFLRSKTAGLTPTTADIDEGELALNLVDRTIYTRNGNNIIDMGFGKGGQVNGNITASGTVKATKLEGPLTGNADSATSLQYARTINGVAFNGTSNIVIADSTKLPLTGGTVTGTIDMNVENASFRFGKNFDIGFVKQAGAGGKMIVGNAYNFEIVMSPESSIPSTILSKDDQTFATLLSLTPTGVLTTPGGFNGNASTATKLQTARTIGGVSFDGTANINLPGVNTAGTQSTTGNAATATSLQTARTINGVAFNGTTNITIADSTKVPLTGGTLTGGLTVPNLTATGSIKAITLHAAGAGGYSPSGQGAHLSWNRSDGQGKTDFINNRGGGPGGFDWWNGTESSYTQLMYLDSNGVLSAIGGFSGNAATATKLQTARSIGITGSGASGSISFDGTGNVNIPLVIATQATTTNNTTIATTAFVQAVNSADTGSAATALALKTARTINGVSFNGTANITIADNTKLPLSGGTITGSLNVSDTITVTNVGDHAGAFKKLIQADTTTDGGYLAVGNNAADRGYVEIGTIDDADAEIYASQRTRANAVTRRAKLLDGAGNTSFPGTVTAPTFSGALSGNATTASSLATARMINGVSFNGTADIQIDAIRVGTITWHLGERSSIFAGDLSLDGQILNRADYPELWSMVNAGRFASVTDAVWLSDVSKRGSYSTGNGSTTFRLPDLNGGQAGSIQSLFLRGSSTTPVGTVLSDAIRNITGSVDAIRMGINWTPKSTGALKGTPSTNSGDANNGASATMVLDIDASRVVPTADENRPKSVFGIWVVSAKGSNVVVPGGSTAATLTGGNTFQGSQTINGDLVVKQNVKVEGLTVDRFGLHDKMHWVGAYVQPYGTSVLNASVTTNTFQVIIRGLSGAKYWTKGRTKLHFIINHGAPQNVRFVTATVTDWSTTDSNKQTITATLSLVNHAMPLNTVFHWVGSTYESFGCDWAGWMNSVGDSRWVMRLKPTTPLKSLTPIISSSCSADGYWNASDLGQPGIEPQPRNNMGTIVVNSVHNGDVVFSIGDNNNDVSSPSEYVSISVKDFV